MLSGHVYVVFDHGQVEPQLETELAEIDMPSVFAHIRSCPFQRVERRSIIAVLMCHQAQQERWQAQFWTLIVGLNEMVLRLDCMAEMVLYQPHIQAQQSRESGVGYRLREAIKQQERWE